MATTAITGATPSAVAVVPKNIYGTGTDLAYAKNKLANSGAYNFNDTGAKGYAGPTGGYTANDTVLGGAGTIGGVVNSGAANRLWGLNSAGTNSAIDNYASTGKNAKYAYGSGIDLTNAKNTLANDYNYIDLSGYKPGSFTAGQGDVLLGGSAVTGAVNQGTAARAGGINRDATNAAIGDLGMHNTANTDAENQINPVYDAQVTAAKNTLASNIASLETSKTGINQNYDGQITDINRNTQINKNNNLNNLAARGLGRSTFFTSGQAGLEDTGNRLSNTAETGRTNDLNNVGNKEADATNATNNTLNTMAADKTAKISDLARTMYGDTWTKNNTVSQQAIAKANADRNYNLAVQSHADDVTNQKGQLALGQLTESDNNNHNINSLASSNYNAAQDRAITTNNRDVKTFETIASAGNISEGGSVPKQYVGPVNSAAAQYNIDPNILAGVLTQEDPAWDAKIVSSDKLGLGLGQFSVATAKQMGLIDATGDHRTDPIASINAAAKYLRNRIDANGGDISAGIRGYNGSGASTYTYLSNVLAHAKAIGQSTSNSAASVAKAKAQYSTDPVNSSEYKNASQALNALSDDSTGGSYTQRLEGAKHILVQYTGGSDEISKLIYTKAKQVYDKLNIQNNRYAGY